MKLTETVIELMFELSNIEGDKYSEYLNGEGDILKNNLMKLYQATNNPESQDIIIDIMCEAGYPWFSKLARSARKSLQNFVDNGVPGSENAVMTEDEFMELLPANGHIH